MIRLHRLNFTCQNKMGKTERIAKLEEEVSELKKEVVFFADLNELKEEVAELKKKLEALLRQPNTVNSESSPVKSRSPQLRSQETLSKFLQKGFFYGNPSIKTLECKCCGVDLRYAEGNGVRNLKTHLDSYSCLKLRDPEAAERIKQDRKRKREENDEEEEPMAKKTKSDSEDE